MATNNIQQASKSGFGTAPVFFTAISTILGAVMFLRFGWAVGNTGLWYAWGIILLGHLITIPTAMAIAEIATNQKVEGGGEYYIISRSFGINTGGAIGIALFLSQAISAAFYIIAFAEAFNPVFDLISRWLDIKFTVDPRFISVPSMILLLFVMIKKGADLGMKMLYFVIGILFLSILLFFLGQTEYAQSFESGDFVGNNIIENPKDFFFVFAVCFPGFTGMTAGVGLSGDLKDPKKSIPIGTLAATFAGMIIYMAIVYKLYVSANPQDLADIESGDLVMSHIALWGPIIPIGLAAATISSAIGSLLVAPRTLQAMGKDGILPHGKANRWLASVAGTRKEPLNATIITAVIAISFLLMGDINAVARIITMFFLVTYGAICTISFFEHFAADPAYRPTFRSKWYLSLLGAVMCMWVMLKMDTFYALLSVGAMFGIYFFITYKKRDKGGLSVIFQGVIFQLSRQLQVFLQKTDKDTSDEHWRPSIVCISDSSFDRFAAFEMLRLISHRYGFGTYIHLIKGYLSKETHEQSEEALKKLIKMAGASRSNVFLDTLVSPSFTSAIAQVVQLPSVSGKENNMIMFEFSRHEPKNTKDMIENFNLVRATNFDIAVLASTEKAFGFKQEIHIWITSKDYENATTMILLGYIILGHPEWSKGNIKLFAVFPEEELLDQKKKLKELISSGRLPISVNNIKLISQKDNHDIKTIINERSQSADLTIIGFRHELVIHDSDSVFMGYDKIGDILFVNTSKEKEIH